MSTRLVTHSVRDLRDALDAAEHDLANGEPGARLAVNYNRRELESMAYNLAADLIDTRDELTTAQSHLTHALDDAAAERTRADAAEAECARLRREPAAYKRERDAALARESAMAVERDAQRTRADAAEAECARLRAYMAEIGAEDVRCACGSGGHPRACKRHPWGYAAHVAELNAENASDWMDETHRTEAELDAQRAIVEGRSAPTEAEVRAHAATGGRWRARLSHGGVYTARCPDAAILGREGALWWAIDRDDNNCPWPTVAAEAATGAALAGEGRTTERAECRCGHPVEMHRGADRCGAYGCGCDLSAEEAGWS